MAKFMKRTLIYSSVLFLLLLFQVTWVVLSEPVAVEEKGPEIRLGEVTFGLREFQSAPSSLRILEIQIEVLNRSRSSIAPENSIKVVAIPKEIKYAGGASVPGYIPTQEETTLTVPLPPSTGRILIIGFPLPETKPESITFEIQINPPNGEKQTVKWEGSGIR
jgi:hypothetical protein